MKKITAAINEIKKQNERLERELHSIHDSSMQARIIYAMRHLITAMKAFGFDDDWCPSCWDPGSPDNADDNVGDFFRKQDLNFLFVTDHSSCVTVKAIRRKATAVLMAINPALTKKKIDKLFNGGD